MTKVMNWEKGGTKSCKIGLRVLIRSASCPWRFRLGQCL